MSHMALQLLLRKPHANRWSSLSCAVIFWGGFSEIGVPYCGPHSKGVRMVGGFRDRGTFLWSSLYENTTYLAVYTRVPLFFRKSPFRAWSMSWPVGVYWWTMHGRSEFGLHARAEKRRASYSINVSHPQPSTQL